MARPGQPCAQSGCPNLQPCDLHAVEQKARHSRFYVGQQGVNYGTRWKKLRALFLQKHPVCVDCQAEGLTKLATEVDHEIPHRGDYALFWDESNWRPRCKPHHSAKTAKEVGFR